MEQEAFFIKASQELTFDEGTLTATTTVSGATMPGSSTAITATTTPGPLRWERKQTSNDIHALRMAGIPKKHNQSCWCLSVWKEQAQDRLQKIEDPDELQFELNEEITLMSPEAMNFWLSRFVVEARKMNGSEYPPNTLYQICCGLGRVLRNVD